MQFTCRRYRLSFRRAHEFLVVLTPRFSACCEQPLGRSGVTRGARGNLRLTFCVSLGQVLIQYPKRSQKSLCVEGGFIDEHDWNVVANRVEPPALGTFQRFVFLGQWGFADGANQNLEKGFVDHFGNSTPSGHQRERRSTRTAREGFAKHARKKRS